MAIFVRLSCLIFRPLDFELLGSTDYHISASHKTPTYTIIVATVDWYLVRTLNEIIIVSEFHR